MRFTSGSAIATAVTHAISGIVLGGLIEALLPKYEETSPAATQIFELCVQAGLNGALLATLTPLLASPSDATHGIVFSTALMDAQPQLRVRIEKLALVLQGQTRHSLQQMALPISAP